MEILLGFVVLLILCALWRKRHKPDLVACEAMRCTKHVPQKKIHRVVSFSDLSEYGESVMPGAGTSVSGDYCHEHCPGECNHGCPVEVSA